MPLDGTNFKPKIKPLETGLAGLKQLGDALRYSVPAGFGWNFTSLGHYDCGTAGCAMGFMRFMWPSQVTHPGDLRIFTDTGVSENELGAIFGWTQTSKIYSHRASHAHVTPADVADAIDVYIKRKEAEGRAA